jgi:hypothetical protein
MPENDINKTTTTNMTSGVSNFSVSSKQIDEPSKTTETVWQNENWPVYLGYLKSIPEYKEAVKALARWSIGRGYETDEETRAILDHLTGAGEDSFQSIMNNHIIVKKTNGDAYTEIIEDTETGTLINLKPLNPSTMKTVFNEKGIIIRYEEIDPSTKAAKRTFKPIQILHSMNDRIANETHGTSVLEACKWVIDARNEAMNDWRRVCHRSTIRVLYVDVDNTTKLSSLKTQYADAISKGEVLILPMKKGDIELEDITVPPIDPFIRWIQYLEGFFYQAVGVPKAIANTADFTEAASKVGYMTFEPVYVEEQTLLEQDLWNQLGIRIKFNRPPSLSGMMQDSEAANTGQVGFQPNEMTGTVGRVE